MTSFLAPVASAEAQKGSGERVERDFFARAEGVVVDDQAVLAVFWIDGVIRVAEPISANGITTGCRMLQ